MSENFNKKFLKIAINLAKRNLSQTSENPSVGCVIVKNGEIISHGATAISGRPHAEKIAISKILDKKLLENCELYVSLEPCCHHGKTEPCVDLIANSGIKKVVIAAIDNDERVSGRGIAKLREFGIEVEICEMAEAYEVNRGFFKAKASGLPFVTLKLAMSLDGKIACKNGESKWITSEKARRFSHILRTQNQAIMIGANTLKRDNPRLDCRILGLEEFSPQKIIYSPLLSFDDDFEIFQSGSPAFIATCAKNRQKIANFKNCHGIFGENLEEILREICKKGLNSILVEGGKKLASELLQRGFVDEIQIFRSNKIIGEDGISAFGEFGFESIDEVFSGFDLVSCDEIGNGDSLCVYRR